MDFESLKHFLTNKMRMSHIYQPVMILELLSRNGIADKREIAEAILSYDESQKEYYEKITTSMVGRVLTKNNNVTTKTKNTYSLNGFKNLNTSQVKELKLICEDKILNYLDNRKNVWHHRKKASGYISGSIRLEVFKRSKTKCEMCGVDNKEKALEVDHIIPRNKGGSDDISNLQALCYSCNSIKRDKDDTDLASVRQSYSNRKKDCIFCYPEVEIIDKNELAFLIYDKYPVTKYHTLIIPKRHVETYFDLYQPEINAVNQLIAKQKSKLDKLDNNITGYNIGINSGKSAGQTIFHCHIHLIPRRNNDMPNPAGGVRGVIPNKMKY
ncbi:HIT domain-containing protein [Flavobacteriaceae bacterium]|jgi:ATP adenylyltransferase|nr:HIT domain-containing protein [Flavobacteriaceae bacterium]